MGVTVLAGVWWQTRHGCSRSAMRAGGNIGRIALGGECGTLGSRAQVSIEAL